MNYTTLISADRIQALYDGDFHSGFSVNVRQKPVPSDR